MGAIELVTRIAAPVEACFDLSLSVDAHQSSMRRSRERIVGGVRTGSMRLGETVTWRAWHFGVPFTMTSVISVYERPTRFVDEQVSGPFASWRHEHLFIEDADATVMTDRALYRPPLGPLGRTVDVLVLRRRLEELLHVRNAWLAAELQRR